MSGSFGTRNEGNVGLSAGDLRHILGGLYPTEGIIKGLEVKGNGNLTYKVSSGVGSYSRGDSDGTRIFYIEDTNTPEVEAGNASNPRIDSVWVKCNDPDLDKDKDGSTGLTTVVVGVTSGIPSSSPVAPTLDDDQMLLRNFLVQPAVTNLSNGATAQGSRNFAIPYGGSLGILHNYVSGTTGVPSNQNNLRTEGTKKINFATDRTVRLHLMVSLSKDPADNKNTEGGYWMYFRVDGRAVYRGQQSYSNQRWDNANFDFVLNVSEGSHTFDFQYAKTPTSPRFIFNTTNLMKSMVFTVKDEGVAV